MRLLCECDSVSKAANNSAKPSFGADNEWVFVPRCLPVAHDSRLAESNNPAKWNDATNTMQDPDMTTFMVCIAKGWAELTPYPDWRYIGSHEMELALC